MNVTIRTDDGTPDIPGVIHSLPERADWEWAAVEFDQGGILTVKAVHRNNIIMEETGWNSWT